MNRTTKKQLNDMNTELIGNALRNARNLILNEMDSIINEEMRDEYENTLEEINLAIKELNGDED